MIVVVGVVVIVVVGVVVIVVVGVVVIVAMAITVVVAPSMIVIVAMAITVVVTVTVIVTPSMTVAVAMAIIVVVAVIVATVLARLGLLQIVGIPPVESVLDGPLCATVDGDPHLVESVDGFAAEVPTDQDVGPGLCNRVRRRPVAPVVFAAVLDDGQALLLGVVQRERRGAPEVGGHLGLETASAERWDTDLHSVQSLGPGIHVGSGPSACHGEIVADHGVGMSPLRAASRLAGCYRSGTAISEPYGFDQGPSSSAISSSTRHPDSSLSSG
ncbi:dinitrogenase iron-molybdenum cofactor biosynthesis protein [Halanaeroarchaeum sulfurireducens]|uniref:Dinitrogenase iron-molybdenum cofactor biosynthesis protein n=1 Tax=Halanaeroarchaeum sulfurireducens TaxID=1604004 RepID=A0A0F7P5X1_9EURY|nr:dinitrogenase iron-molybdenum cofactor biosynthesis protein [Halanaeroarchaeum sulfurireducens]ALG80983.1 dinitrogenase iron-molybdenum cofactor biosynthesis protein [Halanaeroarchaeum sulfurireducens]